MAEQRIIGLAGIDYAAVPASGVPVSWTALGATYRDEATLAEADPTETEHYSNEDDDPIEVSLIGGKKTIAFSLIDYTPSVMATWLGGTVSGTGDTEAWNAPDTKFSGEKSFRLRSRDGKYITFPRVKFHATVDWTMSPNGIAKIKVKGTVMNPADATAPMIRGKIV